MTVANPITLSSLDLERLHDLLDSGRYDSMPGIELLRGELNRANVVDPKDVPADLVTMNSTVHIADESSGASHQLTLVYPQAAQAEGTVSVLAPVGSALLGLRVGESIAWPGPAGRSLRLKVLSIVRQPEAEGEFHR